MSRPLLGLLYFVCVSPRKLTPRPPPPRPGTGSFDLLVYTNADSSVPTNWEESDPRYINNSETVKLRSFTTKVHKVGAMVSYRVED